MTERRSMMAERDTTDRYLAAFLADRVGSEFDGTIAGIARFGLFVKLDDTGADGLVPISSLGREYFRLRPRQPDPDRRALAPRPRPRPARHRPPRRGGADHRRPALRAARGRGPPHADAAAPRRPGRPAPQARAAPDQARQGRSARPAALHPRSRDWLDAGGLPRLGALQKRQDWGDVQMIRTFGLAAVFLARNAGQRRRAGQRDELLRDQRQPRQGRRPRRPRRRRRLVRLARRGRRHHRPGLGRLPLDQRRERPRPHRQPAPGPTPRARRSPTDVATLHSDANNLTKATALDEKGNVINGRGDTPNRHDVLTGSLPDGTAAADTCSDWTSGADGAAMLGHHDRTGLDDSRREVLELLARLARRLQPRGLARHRRRRPLLLLRHRLTPGHAARPPRAPCLTSRI